MDNAVGRAPIVPELGIVGVVRKALRVLVEVADQLQELGQDCIDAHEAGRAEGLPGDGIGRKLVPNFE